MPTGLFTLKQQVQALAQKAWTGTQKTNYVEYLVVAGGGGGSVNGGGAGAGGLLTGMVPVVAGTSYTVTVGAGGVGGYDYSNRGSTTAGQNSVFGSITATGGGQSGTEGVNWGNGASVGASGGSGGGGGYSSSSVAGGQGTSGQGNAGGSNGGGALNTYGGGGGAGTVGFNTASASIAGNGGAGIASAITGTVTTYAGGGGGGGSSTTGGVGGGGGGAYNAVSTAGAVNTGGGAGGSGGGGGTGASGGSGIVIIRYPSTFADAASVTNGTKTTANGYTIYTFTSSGSITL